MDIEDIKRVNKQTIKNAGVRYTLNQDENVPNVKISSLDDSLDGLINGPGFKQKIIKLSEELEKEFDKVKTKVDSSVSGRNLHKPVAIINGLVKFSECKPGECRSLGAEIKDGAKDLLTSIGKARGKLYQLGQKRREFLHMHNDKSSLHNKTDDDELEKLREQSDAIGKYLRFIRDLLSFLDSPEFELHFNNCALILGKWGTGKTHYLCDFASNYSRNEIVALVVLAKNFRPDPDVGTSLAKHTGLASSIEGLIEEMNLIGAKNKQRALLIIDGVNEGDQKAWRKDIAKIVKRIKERPNVGLILSCRQPSEKFIFTDENMSNFVKLNHEGFTGSEFEAQIEFFNFYKIPLPEVPLLAEEFSRPLTLKIICEAFRDLPKKDKKRGFTGISSGQKGMTYVLEQFIKVRARRIESKLKLPSNFCWNLIKGNGRAKPEQDGLAPLMAHRMQEYVSKESFLGIIMARKEIVCIEYANLIFQHLISEGIIAEDTMQKSNSDDSLHFVRFSYQRFGDHLIARHLLKHLETKDEKSIRRSFYKNRKLGSIFNSNLPHSYGYKFQGWVEALVVEFPERVKKILPKDEGELFFYLPKSKQDLDLYFDLFVGGFFWRSPKAINNQTNELVGKYFWNKRIFRRNEMLEALVSVSTKPEHPYRGERLYKKFEKLSIAERDLTWSEFLRCRPSEGVVERIIIWFEQSILPRAGEAKTEVTPQLQMGEASALNQLHILSLFLTTNDRLLRDKVTYIIVRLGELYPAPLFELTLKCLSFSDPYVPERMLAACYGVAMSLGFDLKAEKFHEVLPGFARSLVKHMFTSSGDMPTHHALMREYALGIIEIARIQHKGCIATKYIKFIKPPFPDVIDAFPSDCELSSHTTEDANHAIHMDFEHDVLERLVPTQIYPHKNPKYKELRKKIEWRIHNLGYRLKKFEDIDHKIGERNWRHANGNQGGVDQYGKKYSWIAYFEMYGLLKSRGNLPNNFQTKRASRHGIDPSFFLKPKEWKPKLKDIFSKSPTNNLEWIKNGPTPNYVDLLKIKKINDLDGPWVLLNGHIQEHDGKLQRKVSSFINGCIVARANVDRLEQKVKETKCSDLESKFPEIGSDSYLFAGEIPWSKRFAGEIRSKPGSLLKVGREAFSCLPLQTTRWEYRWEGRHSELNSLDSFWVPSPYICEKLSLKCAHRDIDLLDTQNKKASLYRELTVERWQPESQFLFLRQDLLEQYLEETNKELVWVVWGEREYRHDASSETQKIYPGWKSTDTKFIRYRK